MRRAYHFEYEIVNEKYKILKTYCKYTQLGVGSGMLLVGSLECKRCRYYLGKFVDKDAVACTKYMEDNPVKKDFDI